MTTPATPSTPTPILISDFEQLRKLVMANRYWDFFLTKGSGIEADEKEPKQRLRIELRALTADEVQECNRITDKIRPPSETDKKTNQTTYDTEDPEYQERMKVGLRQKKTAWFVKGLISFQIPGDTLQEQAVNLYKQMPIGVIEDIYNALMELTGDPFKDALFTSTGN
jgi:hypothetical protein